METPKKFFVIMTMVILVAIIGFSFKQSRENIKVEIVALKYPARAEISEGPEIVKYLKKSSRYDKAKSDLSYWYLLNVMHNSETKQYYFNSPDYLYDSSDNEEIIPIAQLKTILEGNLAGIVAANPFGQLLTWEEVDEVFPRMSKAKLRDLETGLSLNIQRRGGSAHADIQPLTAQDTAIFKSIYGGKWSWKRRAAILEKDGFYIAASMNGMPHGQGAINGNNFPGHSCLHFWQTKTHSGNNLDLAHQLMVFKAAGLIEDFLKDRSGKEMVEVALTAIAQNDPQLITLSFVLNDNIGRILEYINKIASLKIHSITPGEHQDEYRVNIEWYEVNSGQNYQKELLLFGEEAENGSYLIRPDEIAAAFVGN
ncbi:MAG: hypothetical protein ACOWWO_06635 [Peptococcaceae bacterium]